jgi:hypothetical protein
MIKNNENQSSKRLSKRVNWDEEKLAEQAEDRKKHPKMKITEPKTPFNNIGDDETDEYLIKLKEANSIVADDDMINKVLMSLNERSIEDERENQYMNDEEYENKKREKNKEMQKKAYANEFLLTKKMFSKGNDSDCDEDDSIKETLENTVFNKYVGKLSIDLINERKEEGDEINK